MRIAPGRRYAFFGKTFAGYVFIYTNSCVFVSQSQLLLEQFRKVAGHAKNIKAEKQKEKDDAERRRQEVLRKKREAESQPAVTELTDEEADRLQREIVEEK